MKFEFGTYVQIYEPSKFATNTLRSRTTGAIALTATGNVQGDFHFLSLVTGRRLNITKPTEMIDCVNEKNNRSSLGIKFHNHQIKSKQQSNILDKQLIESIVGSNQLYDRINCNRSSNRIIN
jgi:hypothetical protein